MFDTIKHRPTADLVIIFLAGIVGVSVLLLTVGIIIAAAFTDYDTSHLATRVGAIINTLTGAIVGYVAGRGTSTSEAPIRVQPVSGWRGDHIPTEPPEET